MESLSRLVRLKFEGTHGNRTKRQDGAHVLRRVVHVRVELDAGAATSLLRPPDLVDEVGGKPYYSREGGRPVGLQAEPLVTPRGLRGGSGGGGGATAGRSAHPADGGAAPAAAVGGRRAL